MGAKTINHNLLGQGHIQVHIYETPKKIFSLLSYYNLNEKLNNLKQLGAMRHILKGAHYTRYEYMLLQMLLINRMNKIEGLSFSTNFKFDELKLGDKNLSKGDLLQILAILTNIGHFPDTYTASKVWLHFLTENKFKLRNLFRRGLIREARPEFDRIVEAFDYYKIHLFNTLYMLGRYKRKGSDLAVFSKKLLLLYIQNNNTELKELFKYYHTIRRISYLILDSNYVSIPFRVELPAILQIMGDLNDPNDLINKNAVFFKSLKYIDKLLQETLYISPETMLKTYNQGELLREKFNSYRIKDFHKKLEIKNILHTQNSDKDEAKIFDPDHQQDFDVVTSDTKILTLDYDMDNYKSKPFNLIEVEDEINDELGRRNGIFTMEITPNRTKLRIATCLLKDCRYKVKKSLELIGLLIRFNNKLEKKGIYKGDQNKFALKSLKFILEHCFNKYSINFDYTQFDSPPFFFAQGSQTVANQVRAFLEEHENEIEKSIEHEFKALIAKLEKIEYTGYVIAYAGSTQIMDKKTNEKRAEFDGIICMPNKVSGSFIYVIEAKGGRKGESAGMQQLNRRLKHLLNKNIVFKSKTFGRRNAFATLVIEK